MEKAYALLSTRVEAVYFFTATCFDVLTEDGPTIGPAVDSSSRQAISVMLLIDSCQAFHTQGHALPICA